MFPFRIVISVSSSIAVEIVHFKVKADTDEQDFSGYLSVLSRNWVNCQVFLTGNCLKVKTANGQI